MATINDPGDHDGHDHFNGMCVDGEPPICGETFGYHEEGQPYSQECDLEEGHPPPHANEANGVTEQEG